MNRPLTKRHQASLNAAWNRVLTGEGKLTAPKRERQFEGDVIQLCHSLQIVPRVEIFMGTPFIWPVAKDVPDFSSWLSADALAQREAVDRIHQITSEE